MFRKFKKQSDRDRNKKANDNSTDQVSSQRFVAKEFENQIEHIQNLVRGNVLAQCPNHSNVIRVFTSSTFTDTKHERDILMTEAYPSLKDFCRKLGFEFQVVDMRWGVRFETVDDHRTTELCLSEIRNCNRLSRGPTFVTFLSHKYGYRPFPREIAATEFDKIVAKVDKPAKALFNKWFKLDSNAVPLAYVLQPISSVIAGYNEAAAPADRRKFGRQFWEECDAMQAALLKVVGNVLAAADAEKFFISVTESEISSGLLNAKRPELRCLWFKRDIVDIHEQDRDNPMIHRFCDFSDKLPNGKDSQSMLQQLKEQKIPAILPKSNIVKYKVNWSQNGIDPQNVAQHLNYLQQLSSAFQLHMKSLIMQQVVEDLNPLQADKQLPEICQHLRFAQVKVATYEGRAELTQRLERRLLAEGGGGKPMVVYGESGCGKTSLMAKLAMAAANRPAAADGGGGGGGAGEPVIFLRFLGTTQASSSLRELFYSLLKQAYRVLNAKKMPPQGKSVKFLAASFQLIMKRIAAAHPVYVILDSIDQLKPDDSAHSCFWVPKQLPDNCWFIVSTLPQHFDILATLQSMLTSTSEATSDSNFTEVPLLQPADCKQIVRHQLRLNARTLTQKQLQLLLSTVEQVALPLFLKICVDRALTWTSFTRVSEQSLGNSVRLGITQLFLQLEKKHGQLLVHHALAFLTISSAGLSESEMEDILALDDDVLNDTFEYWVPPVRRLPPLAITRVMADLQDYLVEQGSEGAPTLRWYHRQFWEAATDRYCADAEQLMRLHALVAEFFSGEWADKPKPYIDLSAKGSGQKGEALRYVAAQPIRLDTAVYNGRKLVELPHHLMLSQQLQQLKSNCLLNFEFLHPLLKVKGIDFCIDIMRQAQLQFPDDDELKQMGNFLSQSHQTLSFEADLLPLQLLQRLPENSSSSSSSSSSLANLRQQAAAARGCKIYLPVDSPHHKQQQQQQQQGLQYSIAKHSKSIVGLEVTSDFYRAVTVGEDNCVSFWEVGSGSCLRTVQLSHDVAWKISFVNNDKDVVVSTDAGLYVLQFGSGVHIRTFLETDATDITGDKNNKQIVFHVIKSGNQIVLFGTKYLTIFNCSDWSQAATISLDEAAAVSHPKAPFESGAGFDYSTPVDGHNKLLAICEPQLNLWVYLFDLEQRCMLQCKKYFREKTDEEIDNGESEESICSLHMNSAETQLLMLELMEDCVYFCELPSMEVLRKVVIAEKDNPNLSLRINDMDNQGKQLLNDRYLLLAGTKSKQPCIVIFDCKTSSKSYCCEHSSANNLNAVRADALLKKVVTVGSDACFNLFDRSQIREESEQQLQQNSESVSYYWRNIFALGEDQRYIVYSGSRTTQTAGVKEKRKVNVIIVMDVIAYEKVREITIESYKTMSMSHYHGDQVVIDFNNKGYLYDLRRAKVLCETQGFCNSTEDVVGNFHLQKLISISRGQRSLKLHSAADGRAHIAVKNAFGCDNDTVISEMKVSPGGRYIAMVDQEALDKFLMYDTKAERIFEIVDAKLKGEFSLYDAFFICDDSLLVTLQSVKFGRSSISCPTVWDIDKRQRLHTLCDRDWLESGSGKADDMDILYFAHFASNLLAAVSDDGYLRMFDLISGKLLAREKAHANMISGVHAPAGQSADAEQLYMLTECDDDAEMSIKCWSFTRSSSQFELIATYRQQEQLRKMLPMQNCSRVLLMRESSEMAAQICVMDPDVRNKLWQSDAAAAARFGKFESLTLKLNTDEKFAKDPNDPDDEDDIPDSDDDDNDDDDNDDNDDIDDDDEDEGDKSG